MPEVLCGELHNATGNVALISDLNPVITFLPSLWRRQESVLYQLEFGVLLLQLATGFQVSNEIKGLTSRFFRMCPKTLYLQRIGVPIVKALLHRVN